MNRYMRIIVMFDLPTITDKDKKIAQKFRNFLLDDGYIMVQFSIYSRICKNNDDLLKHINRLKIKSPKNGNIRILQVTENQYNSMILLCGERINRQPININNLENIGNIRNISTNNLIVF